MAKSRAQLAAEAPAPRDWGKELEQARVEEQRHRGCADELLKQKQEKQKSLVEKNAVITKSINEVVGGLPESDSSDLVAKILSLRNPDRSQLIEDVDKLSIAIEAENRLATAARLKAKELEAQIEEEAKDAACVAMHEAVLGWLEKYKVCNGQRHRLFEATSRCGFRDFAARMKRLNLKAGIVVGTLCESYLSKPERRDELNVSAIATAIQDLGKAYGVTLLAQGDERVHGAEDVPMHRENYFAGYGKAEQMKPTINVKK